MQSNRPCNIVMVLTDFERIIKTQEKNVVNCVSREQESIYLKLYASYNYAKEIIVNHLINEFSIAVNILDEIIVQEPCCIKVNNLIACKNVLTFCSYEKRREVLDTGIQALQESLIHYSEPYHKSINAAIDYLQKYNGMYLK